MCTFLIDTAMRNYSVKYIYLLSECKLIHRKKHWTMVWFMFNKNGDNDLCDTHLNKWNPVFYLTISLFSISWHDSFSSSFSLSLFSKILLWFLIYSTASNLPMENGCLQNVKCVKNKHRNKQDILNLKKHEQLKTMKKLLYMHILKIQFPHLMQNNIKRYNKLIFYLSLQWK